MQTALGYPQMETLRRGLIPPLSTSRVGVLGVKWGLLCPCNLHVNLLQGYMRLFCMKTGGSHGRGFCPAIVVVHVVKTFFAW